MIFLMILARIKAGPLNCVLVLLPKMVSACSASGFGTDEVRSITVHLKDHVTGAVDDFCARVARCVVEKVDGGIVGRFNMGAGSDIIQGMHHGVIGGPCIEEELSCDLLQEFYFFRR